MLNQKKGRKPAKRDSTRIKINASFDVAIGALLAVKPKRKRKPRSGK